MKKLLGALGIWVLLFASTSVFAIATYIDSTPPTWRGDAGSTVQGWEFSTSVKTPDPDLLDNVYGDPELIVIPTKPGYQESWGNHYGVWHLSGAITAVIPNNPVLNAYKLVQVQFVWASEDGTSVPCVSLDAWLTAVDVDPVPEGNIILLDQIDTQLEATGVTGAGEYWWHTTCLFLVIPNPAFELITIGSAVWVDGLVIDTICIPEPASICLLGFAALAFLRVRK